MFSGKLPELWLWIKLEILVRICRAGPLTSSLWLYNLTARCHFRLVLLSIKDLKQLILSRHKVNAEWLGEGKAEQRPQIPKLVKNPSILSSREYKLIKSYIKSGLSQVLFVSRVHFLPCACFHYITCVFPIITWNFFCIMLRIQNIWPTKDVTLLTLIVFLMK